MGNFTVAAATTSGIKVLDRAVLIMLTVAEHPCTLHQLCEATGLPRATTHRLATALEVHHLLSRTVDGRWTIGDILSTFGTNNATNLTDIAAPLMHKLMEKTGESIQLYQLAGASRVCIASEEPHVGLHNSVPVGARLPLNAGSAAKIFLAHSAPALRDSIMEQPSTFTLEDINAARERGWAQSISEREVGLASITAPIFNREGIFVAALSISGPTDRFQPSPAIWAQDLKIVATQIGLAL
ncbi:IclR family transcriptional regulator [Corynebacterium sp. ES2794-CONJ1]|uniref:IclR family transcriptional regulator n=1 Tax=unclassified Corynebacterium TaxID=2624378 RepID=UPI00216A076C|nr:MULTISPECIES: IclR family transcriptional regulator [unclassified Corynebacterium]MCS4490718.1 IclR family transcriptional regulator [Corynebacterium sp. ES2775-CONJ]MCS4492520.1 IclR family transcriptional regulator [Corynebacterium sp. ES2715-CONJ3]MCS4532621.1 IclR family transcriptional regulator [Corynebacterium sp. ES2730-CONJ]MCU9520016.1 IclR family transcriptional regulator [Corynebacterium sp. ES2794-CONJ1]